MTSPSVKLLRTQSDDRLRALAADGHERAFEAIVERYRRQLLRHCRRYLPEARAEDALQQALMSAWSALQRGDDVRELRPWLHRIVHNTSLNALRAAGYDYEQLRDTLRGGGGPAELAERSAVVRQTLAGLAALPERQRDALLKIAVEGRSQDEVAQELGLSHGAVRQLVHRARSSLRAAATAVIPLPLAVWLASAGGGRGDLVARVGELVAGAGGTATVAKAGAVAALAGGAVGGPAVVDRIADSPHKSARIAAIATPARADDERRPDRRPVKLAATPEPARTSEPVTATATPEPAHASEPVTATATPAPADEGRGQRGGDEPDGSGRGGGDDGDGEDRSGRRGGQQDEGVQEDRADEHGDGEHSGDGDGDEGEREEPVASTEPADSSGPGPAQDEGEERNEDSSGESEH
jgi:RNA polymerase sigma factor (sigma-70 family)